MRFIVFCFCLLTFQLSKKIVQRFDGDSLQVIFFDVGQGDAALVRFPGGKVWILDGGGGYLEWDLGKRELFLELARLGILEIDVAVLSHPDEDHAMGFRGLFEQVSIRQWWFHEAIFRKPFLKPVVRELALRARERSIATRAITEPVKGTEGRASWRVIPIHSDSPSSNDQALVAEINFAHCDFIFTGDIEAHGESFLQQEIHGEKEFLKVAHHGSRTSSNPELLQKLKPRVALVSAGPGNPYGHPHPAIMERLIRVGARTLRTDFHGFVRIDVNQHGDFECRSYKGDCGRGRCY